MSIQPFRFSLQQVSTDALRVLAALHEFLPLHTQRAQVVDAIRQALRKHLDQEVGLRLEHVQTERGGEWIKQMPSRPVIAVFSQSPQFSRCLMQIDPLLAGVCINRLLGGDATAALELHPPTETEQGVLQYLLMQALGALHTACGSAERVHFRFERFCLRPEEIAPVINHQESCAVLSWRVTVAENVGVCRLIIPKAFADAALLTPLGPSKSLQAAERDYLLQRFRNFDWLRTTLWIEGGWSELSAEEMTGLERGDVILLDQSTLSLSGKTVTGAVTLHVGADRERGLHGTIVPGKRFGVKLTSINE